MWEESEQRYAVASLTAPSVPMTAFTEEPREAVVLARERAHARGDERVGTEHLLIGLLDVQEGLAASVLGMLGVTVDAVCDHVLRMGAPGQPVGVVEDVTVTPRSRKVLELALREAIVLGSAPPAPNTSSSRFSARTNASLPEFCASWSPTPTPRSATP